MNEATVSRVPSWYWAVSVLALLWTLMGVASYLMQVYGAGAGLQPGMSEAQRTLDASMPAWVTGAFALAVFGGLLGSIGLLLRKRWARSLFILSLVAALAQFGWVLVVSDALALLGKQAAVFPIVILFVCVALVWFAHYADKRGWLA